MKLNRLFQDKNCAFALEVFPPKKQSGIASVFTMLEKLKTLPADYISVTYSAGGTGNSAYTAQIARHLKQELGIEPLAHLTCLNSSRELVQGELAALQADGVENILALRGDKNPDVPPQRDFSYASELAALIAEHGGFYTVGACYPEGHPECESLAKSIDHLKLKVEAGVGHLVSQLFFDNGKFYRFLNLARKKGLACPVEAGIMPITKPEQISRTVALSSTSLPSAFSKWVSRWSGDAQGFYDAGIHYAITQCRDLIEAGADGIHLYAMNNADVAWKVYEGIQDLL